MVPVEPSQMLAPPDIQDQVLSHVPEIQQIARVDFSVIFNLDSANIQIHHWQQLARHIYENYPRYDGFVIIHGTDAMVYTAAALSFMLPGIRKPVIFTGSQRPLAQIRSDARSNLINSLELATHPIPEVAIFFGTRLFRGNRTLKISSTHYDAFDSPNFPPLAEVGLDIEIARHLLLKPGPNPLALKDALDTRVFSFQFFPGLKPEYLKALLESPLKAVVIEALGVGNLAVQENSLIPWIKDFTRAGKLVVITSQSPYGRTDLNLYECGQMIQDAGGISAHDMTTPTTIVKLMFLLGQYAGEVGRVRDELTVPLAGEISPEETENRIQE